MGAAKLSFTRWRGELCASHTDLVGMICDLADRAADRMLPGRRRERKKPA